jgi:enediyne biosynthesis protein E4
LAKGKEHRESGGGALWLAAGVAVGALGAAALIWAGTRLLAPSVPAERLPPPQFVEESAGVDHRYDGEFNFFVGGGVAVLDCNQDRLPDLYFAGGVNRAVVLRNQSTVGGALAFEPVDQVGALTAVVGAYPLDVDGDGFIDLAVLRYGENVMLRGLGNCEFERANEIWNVDGGDEWTAAFSARWDQDAELPTMVFGNYLAPEGQQTGECSDHYLFRPVARSYGPPTVLTPGWCTLSILFSDWDRSGRVDLRMTNDRHYYREGQEQLWRIEDGATPQLYTAADGWQRMQIWGMGIASQDLTGDGLPEVLLTSQGDNKLQTLVGGRSSPNYRDIAFERGATAHRPFAGDDDLPSTAWHAEFEDVNNDSFMDLYIAKGNVEAQTGYAARDPSNLLLGNPDGTFTEGAAEAGLLNFARARGAAVVDLNLDGMLDLVEVNRRENVELWRNLGSGGNWLEIELQQPGANRHGIGSWLELDLGGRVISRELTVGGGHAGGQLGWTHFGLGEGSSARLRVIWPDGETSPWWRVTANRFLTVTRDQEAPVQWKP